MRRNHGPYSPRLENALQAIISSFVTLAIVMITLFLTPTTGTADILNIDAAINKAGMQRMLTQRIAKSYLLIGQDVATDTALKQLDGSVALFEQNLGELEDFSPTREITASLGDIRDSWNQFRQSAISQPKRDQALSVIKQASRLLELCDKNVQLFETYSGGRKGELINLAGRQRMLSQRIGMLYVAKSWRIDDQTVEEGFALAMKDFDSALGLLTQSPLNTEEINQALSDVVSQWQFSRSGFELDESGRHVPFVIQVTTESILKKMDAITNLYTSLGSS
ncbi:hypothetical protein RE428_12510 [Marinobacter nanhaiticus D15-8W]|uniref:Pilus assembly protein PilP n=1 Tax=Marinobacter nanhaiticus D15-8W TaxID=626887 RepID=N6WP99_9GAMM|nr:type IV pili methyl-accepting chemotaxis transducer N-terminal domain-containing protein [Marinobacter nanhaiticus]ENO12882.1 pilus assembly protein PilP [Marinobacter nanhaiticus D15-8W]BES70233.1 hypothetical protein RE428_12510 [Marinobacter nanhaiticus D15-8W]